MSTAPNVWFTAAEVRSWIRKVVRTRQELLRSGASRIDDQAAYEAIKQLEPKLYGGGYRHEPDLQAAGQLFLGNLDRIERLIPGVGSGAHAAFRRDFEALLAQCEAVARFYAGDPQRMRFPFYLRRADGRHVTKLCTPQTCVTVTVDGPDDAPVATVAVRRLEREHLRWLAIHCEPCGPAVFRRLVMAAAQAALSVADASHHALPLREAFDAEAVLQQAARAADEERA